MKGEEKKRHEGRGVPGRLPVESEALQLQEAQGARGYEKPPCYFFHVANDAPRATSEFQWQVPLRQFRRLHSDCVNKSITRWTVNFIRVKVWRGKSREYKI